MNRRVRSTAILLPTLFFLAWCFESRAAAQVPSDPLSQMELAFEGDFSRSQIKARLDRAMQLYKLPITSENYSRAGSTLVALRKHIGPREMDILDYMIRSHVAGVNMSFPDAAGLSAAFLARRR